MAIEVVVPMLGITVEKGTILRWLKKEGDWVQKGEPLFEVETEKVVTEVESPGTGILKKIIIPENLEVPVLTLVAVITQPNEDLPLQYQAVSPLPAAGVVPTAAPAPQAAPPSPPVSMSRPSSAPRALVILGAGPGGYVAAIRAAQLGMGVTLVEKGELGGTCLNWGCIPTKSFLADVKLLRKIKSSEVFANKEALAIDWPKMTARKNRVVETLRSGVLGLLKSQKVKLVRGQGKFIEPHSLEITCEGKKEIIRAEATIIATGSHPSSLPGIPFDKKVLSSDDVFLLNDPPKELAIIGGGVIGVEFAMIFNSLGTKVTLLELLPQIISTEEPEIIQGLHRLLEKEGIRILTRAEVLRAFPQNDGVRVVLQRESGGEGISAEKVLMAVGRKPNTEGLGLDKAGIRMDKSFIEVNSRMETNVPGIYAVGDVTGKMMLAHAASAQGIVAVENIAGKNREMDYQKIPSCIYTFPEVASVGLKEEEARQQGYELRVGRFPFRYSGKALAIGEPEGFAKIIAEKELGQILGVHIIGERATDLIGECVLAMNLEGTIEEWGEVVKGHPTLSEILTEAALDWQGLAIHSPKK